ncbi:hypothetical protein E1A91_A06G218300v1 [Gossypium mustelinum]|uniref:PSI domain-containing protein n=2 Tax=Gossypium TaxID=3633 RepID=A0A5D2Z0B2_GOSMU|nr:hypothetical protein ES288_A06G241700v1 [Gossypium darwinii]TYJ31709.1 hypothetical protein E1A91_A06G218300v1 [Gossypium mustelinum]
METKPSSKIPLFFPILFLLLSTLTQPSLSSSIDTIIINGKDPSISLRRRILLASQRNNKMNQIPNCGERVSRSQCLQNPKCRWCRSEALDDMCFKKAEAWRLPQQFYMQIAWHCWSLEGGCPNYSTNF